MNAIFFRLHRSVFCASASAADPEKIREYQRSVKPSPAASPSTVLSHSVEKKLEGSPTPPPASTSFSKSLPLPLPIHLTLPSLPQRAVLPSPLKFLWFHRENSLEKAIIHEKEKEPENSESLSLASAPRLGDVDTASEKLESGVEDTQSRKEEESTSEKSKSWMPNLVNLAYLQSKYGFRFPKSGGEDVLDHHHVRVPGLCHECECKACEGDHYLQSEAKLKKHVMRFEVPVVHDKDSLRPFLHRVHYADLKFISRMSFLANQAYFISGIKEDELLNYHGLRFVTSSFERKAVLAAKEKAAREAQEKSARGSEDVSAAESEAREKNRNGAEVKTEDGKSGPAQSTYALAATAASYLAFQTKSFLPFKSPEHIVPKEENDDISVASDDDDDELFRHLDLEAWNDESSGETAKLSTDEEILSTEKRKVVNSEAQQALEDSIVKPSESQVGGDLVPVVGAASATGLVASGDDAKDAVAEVLQSDAACPSEWFVCDEEDTSTRFFVIQGSDSLASWQANLLFESSLFEDPEWGVMVHRGFYEAAKGLYEQLMPLIQAHVDCHGDKAKFYFTGHSLGGSLSTLLTLMLRHRGVLPLPALLPVYTFGSPSIMCGGDWLLEKLGFPINHIRSVVMHYDIVPRSFACHYPDQIVEVLKRFNGTFRKNACLEQQKLMYATMGKMLILQPDQQQAPNHPLLPPGVALYEVRHPKLDIYQDSIKDPHSHTMALTKEVRSAERSFLNTPHPLEILIDPASYGSEGTISRDHDAASYLRAVNTVLKKEFRKRRRLDKDQMRIRTPLRRSKSGKRYSRPVKDAESSIESGPVIIERTMLQRSLSFLKNASQREVASDSQMEPLAR